MSLMFSGDRKKQLIVTTIYAIIYAFIAFSYLVMFFNSISILQSDLYIFSIFFALISYVGTGIIFALKTMKIGDKERIWNGRFLLIVFIAFTIGAIGEAISVLKLAELPQFIFIFTKITLISSALEYYLAFFLPKWLKNKLIKE